MKILLFGKTGQVGWELQRSLAPLGELITLGTQSQSLCGDLSDLDGIAATVKTVNPDIIVNAAAYTAVDKAETESAKAHLINGLAPGVLAKSAQAIGACLIHYSTDYVFDGSGNIPWLETDPVAPLGQYGKTKLTGEEAICATDCQYLIFRTSWVYAARGNNFIKTILRLAKDRDSLSIINDQIGAPTGAELIADITSHVIKTALQHREIKGIYHLVASGQTSWYDYARLIIDSAQRSGMTLKTTADAVQPIPSSAYPVPAPRPNNSRLNTHKLQTTFGLTLPDWQYGVKRVLTEILETSS